MFDYQKVTAHACTTSKKTLDLANRKMELQDYKQIAATIMRNNFFEKIIFPEIDIHYIEEVFSLLDNATIFNATLTDLVFLNFNITTNLSQKVHFHYQRIFSRLKRNKNKIFAIHGGGNIGLGLMADIVARSTINYKILSTSSDAFRNHFINYQHQVWLQHSGTENNISCINDISMLDAKNPDNLIHLYLHANLLAICLPEAGIIDSADAIARGLTARYFLDAAELKIIILMNKPNCDKFVKELIEKKLFQQLNSPDLVNQIMENIQFIPTVVDRIACKLNTENVIAKIKAQLQKRSDAKLKNLPVPLFVVEENYNLFVPTTFKEARFLPGIKQVKNINVFMDVKNKFINGPHAILAWLAGLMDFHKIAPAISHPILFQLINNLMEYEIKPILLNVYPEINTTQLSTLKQSFLKRCRENTSDSVKRVARDPLRKLHQDGCIRGILNLKKQHDLSIETPLIDLGIAAAILYALTVDATNQDCVKIRELYQKNSDFKDVLQYCGQCSGGNFIGLHNSEDTQLIKNIIENIVLLRKLTVFQQWKRLEMFNFHCNHLHKNHSIAKPFTLHTKRINDTSSYKLAR